jgi:hypothetical protein
MSRKQAGEFQLPGKKKKKKKIVGMNTCALLLLGAYLGGRLVRSNKGEL